jgi:undecaprenyl-diphosphatase
VVGIGIGLAALVGLSRVYLDAHYLSDVNAGWALGVGTFALCAAVSLVISTLGSLRQNAGNVPGRGAAAGAGEDRQ